MFTVHVAEEMSNLKIKDVELPVKRKIQNVIN